MLYNLPTADTSHVEALRHLRSRLTTTGQTLPPFILLCTSAHDRALEVFIALRSPDRQTADGLKLFAEILSFFDQGTAAQSSPPAPLALGKHALLGDELNGVKVLLVDDVPSIWKLHATCWRSRCTGASCQQRSGGA